jgi:nicotinate-nucleotide adenylyltransferase
MRIALFGGTFDPIHYGHLLCAEEVREAFGFESIWFIPSARPPHKPEEAQRASPEDRYRMVCLAIAENPAFHVSRTELDREGKSYAIDTVREFLADYGADAEIYWILGADSLIEFEIWRDYRLLLDLCRFIAVTRPRYDLNRLPEIVRGRVHLFEMTEIGISSTGIRQAIQEGRSIRYRTPPPVEQYIRERGLYRSQPAK